MIGGNIIENAAVTLSDGTRARRLWCVDKRTKDELCVYAEQPASALDCGEEIWWQSGSIMARGNTLRYKKIANSFDPRWLTSEELAT